ncbi:hypothetical protein RhiirA4_462766 [Rhizophagus irregularis]|uniref:Uncharacterized protein n=1 Tax=Rhizophagus irregularis TaxID=588596 RepID=A0A2I1GLR2_9GLOM|nr:hypothetical protein RhiirA4_462766 [Rhizophagus irregularis]
MASTANNFSLQDTSVTGIFQTATDFEPAIYKHLEGLQTTYADEFYELAQPYTPRGKKRVTYADVVSGSGSDDSRPTSPSPEEKRNTQKTSKKGSTDKKSQQQMTKKSKLTPEKMISTVMTGYTPEDKANVREIWALTNWNNGVWTAPFEGMPVRWFPASWTLKQRKERERFQAVILDIPKSITNNVVYNAESPDQSMLSLLDGALAFKIIQDRGRRKLIVYFDTWSSLDKALNTEFNFEEFKGVWTRYFSPTLNRPRNKPPKKMDSTQKQN